jgi:phosphate transport system permease protein
MSFPPRSLASKVTDAEPLRLSALWALKCAFGLTIGIVTWRWIYLLFGQNGPAPEPLAWTAALTLAVGWLLFFPMRLWWQSRTFQDKSFAWFGVLATFFGLAMLIFFFSVLAWQTWSWFRIMPGLVEKRNQFLITRVEQAEQIMKEEMAKVQGEMAIDLELAATEEEKKEIREVYEKDVIPGKVKDLEVTAKEYQVERDKGMRPDTSPLALLGAFLSQGPSDAPQDAGVYPALLGTLWLALITILFAVPVGVGAALYLEEYRSTSWFGQVIQININNLAGVPSVVYGILGGFVFVWFFRTLKHEHAGLAWMADRNVLGGGLTLGLLTLPVVIVSAQEAIRAVPMSIRHGAYALGATRWQVIWHQVLPLARPGILTGTILSLSRAMGEAAPLVLFGALLFVNQEPSLFTQFTVLPMQIFGWADRPEISIEGQTVPIWHYNAALASLILLLTLLSLNALAIFLRYRAQHGTRW